MKYLITTVLLGVVFLCGCSGHKQIIQIEKPYVFPYPETAKTWRLPLKPKKIFPSISIIAVGDIMLANHATYYLERYGVHYPFDSTKVILAGGDVTLGNLESPFTNSGIQFDKEFTFKVPPEYAIGLIQAGFDVVTLGNNHILDYGFEGLENTLVVLDSIGLAHCGAGLNQEQARQPAIIERNGYRIGILGYSMTFPEEFWATASQGGTNFPNEVDMKNNIQRLDSLTDFTIVTFHWGAESRNVTKPYQRDFAHRAIDCGADLVIGHHPHVLQGIEIYKNRLIAYSLGNFSFSSYSRKSTESIILKAYLTRQRLLFARVIPVSVDNYEVAFQPRILRGARSDTVLAHLNKYSVPLNSMTIIDEDGFIMGIKSLSSDSLNKNQVLPIDSK